MSRLRLLVLASCFLLPTLAWSAPNPGAVVDTGGVGGLPFVTNIRTIPAQPNPHEETRIMIEGVFPNNCGELLGGGEGVSIWIRGLDNCDSLGTTPAWSRAFDLGRLAAGTHQVLITLRVEHAGVPGDPAVYMTYFQFEVHDSIPPGGILPYVDQIFIRSAGSSRPSGPICAGDSILVVANGRFPSPCYRLLRVDLLQPLYSPFPQPPIVRFIVDDGDCIDQVCLEVLTPWEAFVVLPPLPTRDYRLIAQLGVVSCPDSFPRDTVYSTSVPFRVNDCTPPEPCVEGSWGPGTTGCDAHVGPDGRAQVAFYVQSGVPLAGLQGNFHINPLAMRIVGIEAIGHAEGMHVQWRPTADGAKFTMFAEQGAPIPAAPESAGVPVRILRITVERTVRQLPPATYLLASELFGSDEQGNAVPQCQILTLVVVAARICAERGCDFNADGASDVRDLVLMARCLFATETDSAGNVYRQMCADSASVPDCNGDGVKSIADAVCCGIRILRGSDCPNCPPDTTASHPAPGVRVALGKPEYTATGADIFIGIAGLNDLGGAIARFDYPSDRYDAKLLMPGSNGWLNLSDVLDGTATIALIRAVDPSQVYPAELVAAEPLRLRLTLKPGKSHGGEVKLASFEISDPEGAKLTPDAQSVIVPLSGLASLALSEARPNPSAGATRFALTLDRPVTVSVAIYDLGGRLVSTLHRGMLGAGSHDFTWNGARQGGSAAPGGVYFYRAIAESGETASRKLVLIGN